MLPSFIALAIATATSVPGSVPGQLAIQTDDGTDTPPNILVFLSDDMGWGQPGFNGGTEVATPHMDRIADEGVKLTQFYVLPVCTPTRGSLLTGRYDWKNGTETRVGLRSSHGMPTDERTIAEALGDAGYATWVVGKWHLGQWQQEHLPLQRGFDHHYGHYSGEINSFTLHRGRNHRGILDWHRNGRPVVETGYSTFLLADEAVALIERHDGSSPFFLYLPFNAVHNPNDAPQEYIDLYSDSSDPEQRGQLKAMDDAIGQVLNALDDKGVLDDTLIMFLNDNGGTESAGWNAPYRGKKSDYYEGAVRVPAVIRWPGEITAGSESDALLHVVDLFPTFAGLAGADTTSGLPLDGLDAWGAIAEGAASPRTEVVYSLDVIRVGDWKLIEEGIDYYGWTTDAPELYDIAEDPYETTNLAATETAKLTELRARLAYHEPFARDGEALTDIPNHPPKVYGEDENEAFGAAARRAVTKLRQGNPGPSLLRMEAAGSSVKLTYSEALDADSAPSADSFKVVVNPGYASAEVTDVAVSGSAVTLTLAEAPGSGKTVGLTYEVPDADPIRDADELEAVGVTWVTATVTTAFLSADATLSALSLSGIDIGTFSSAVTSYTASVESGVATTTVTATASHASATVAITPGATVNLAEGANTITVTVTAGNGATTQTYTVTVTRAALSADATLSALSLSGIDIGTFSSAVTSYTASVESGVATTTVTATASHASATVAITPGATVNLAEGANTITVTVTAGNGATTQTYTVTVTRAALSADATLSALSLSGIDIGTFSSAVTSYTASVGSGVATTTVTATASHASAVVSITPGAVVTLAEGANQITVTVTAADGTTMQTTTVTVTRAALPVVSIVAVATPVPEGESAEFRVSRTGPTTGELTVHTRITSSNTSTVRSFPVRLWSGQRSRVSLTNVHDNTVVRGDVTVTWTLQESEHYAISAGANSAVVVLEENDAAEFALSVDPAGIAEDESATVEVRITNGVTFAQDQTIEFDFAGSTATKDTDYTVSPEPLVLSAGATRATATVTAMVDADAEGDETVSLAASHDGAAIGTASLTIADSAFIPLTAEFREMPETHDGETAFDFELRFSEEFPLSFRTLRNAAFEVAGGTVRKAQRLVSGSDQDWKIRVKPASVADVVIVLPATTDCEAAAALCTASGKPLSNRLSATVTGPASQALGQGFSLAPENGSPSGIWSAGGTAWVADVEDAKLYAYQRSDGSRQPERDIATDPAPMGLWSEGETLWVAGLDGGLRAHRLTDGSRLPERDLALEMSAAPVGLWSDGETVWVAEWLGDTVHAYRLADGQRVASRDISLAGGNLLPVGLWSDGETVWVADWEERIYAYRLSDGERLPERDIRAGTRDEDPSGLWSAAGTLLSTSWKGSEVRAYRLPAAASKEEAVGAPAIPDPALLAGIAAALGKAGGEAVSEAELAGMETLRVRGGEVEDLTGLEGAVGLLELDLGFNPLADLRPLALLPALESLNLDGTSVDLRAVASLTGLKRLSLRRNGLDDLGPLVGLASLTELDLGDNPIDDLRPVAFLPALESLNLDGTSVDLRAVASLTGLKRLSLRRNGIDDLGPLVGLASLTELDVGDNRIEDLHPLAGLTRLVALQADRNRISNLWPLASLAGLESLDLTANRLGGVDGLAELSGLRTLRLGGNGLTEVNALSGLDGLKELGLAGNAVGDLGPLSDLAGLQRLDLRGNAVPDLRPLGALKSLVWVHVGGSRIEDLAVLDGTPSLAVYGGDDREPPGGGPRAGRANEH